MLIPRQANDDFVHPEQAFAAQSIIRRRFGFFDRNVPDMNICAINIMGALRAHKHYFLSEETTQEQIEGSLQSLARTFSEEGVFRLSDDAVKKV